jgi:hypothetical protein
MCAVGKDRKISILLVMVTADSLYVRDLGPQSRGSIVNFVVLKFSNLT